MKKLKFDGLAIELTRKCNLQCVHCSNGDAQDLTITEEIIDRIFEDVADCGKICIVGGETMLALDKLEYLIDKIISSEWTTAEIQFTTNGTIICDEAISLFDRFCNSRADRYALLRVSSDQFHDKKTADAALQHYTRVAKCNPNILVEPTGDISTLIVAGRGENLIQTQPDRCRDLMFVADSGIDRRLRVKKDTVSCMVTIHANGNVGTFSQTSYDVYDRLAYGNILKSSMTELIEQHNANCLTTCADCDYLVVFGGFDYFELGYLPLQRMGMSGDIIDNASWVAQTIIIREFVKRTVQLRELAKTTFPLVCAADIIKALPTDIRLGRQVKSTFIPKNPQIDTITDDDIRKYLPKNLQECYFSAVQKREAGELEGFLCTLKTMNFKALAALRKYDGDLEPRELFGTEEDKLNCEAFKHLRELNKLYEEGKRTPDNSVCFPCEEDKHEHDEKIKHQIIHELEQEMIRCPNCTKVIRSKGRNIHCREVNGKVLVCDYCGCARKLPLVRE